MSFKRGQYRDTFICGVLIFKWVHIPEFRSNCVHGYLMDTYTMQLVFTSQFQSNTFSTGFLQPNITFYFQLITDIKKR